jgi:hypothetical protein
MIRPGGPANQDSAIRESAMRPSLLLGAHVLREALPRLGIGGDKLSDRDVRDQINLAAIDFKKAR